MSADPLIGVGEAQLPDFGTGGLQLQPGDHPECADAVGGRGVVQHVQQGFTGLVVPGSQQRFDRVGSDAAVGRIELGFRDRDALIEVQQVHSLDGVRLNAMIWIIHCGPEDAVGDRAGQLAERAHDEAADTRLRVRCQAAERLGHLGHHAQAGYDSDGAGAFECV